MNELHRQIAQEFAEEPLDASERDRLWQASRPARDGVPVAALRPRVRRVSRRVVLAAVAAVIAICGVALGAAPGLVERIFGSDDPPAAQIDQFQRAAPPVSAKEYAALQNLTMVPGVDRVGIIKDSEMRQPFELAPAERARVVVDDARVGRVVAAPSRDGKQLCQLYTAPSELHGDHVGGSGGCGGNFDEAGLMAGWGESTGPDGRASTFSLQGIASDDVAAIHVGLRGGRTIDVPLVENAFRWTTDDPTDLPVRVETIRGGRTFRDVHVEEDIGRSMPR